MASINAVPGDILLMIFSYMPTMRDICAIAQVCRRWHHLAGNESLPFNHERLERIAFENISHFDRLPRVRSELQFRTFTIFQDSIIGETDLGTLCVYNPRTGTTSLLDYQPPHNGMLTGEFMTSAESCVYKIIRHLYHIDLVNRTCERIGFKMKYRTYAVLGKKIYSWQIVNLTLEYIRICFEKQQRHGRHHPYVEMQVYDLEDHSTAELAYRTHKKPSVCISGGRMLLTESHVITILDATLNECESIRYQFAFNALKTHLLGKKLICQTFSAVTIKGLKLLAKI